MFMHYINALYCYLLAEKLIDCIKEITSHKLIFV